MEIANQEPCEKNRDKHGNWTRASFVRAGRGCIQYKVDRPALPSKLFSPLPPNKPFYFLFLQQRMSDTLV